MGLFSRRKAAVVEDATWKAVGGGLEVVEGDEAGMDDEGQAIDRAYQVVHESPEVPGARITIWTYAAYTGADGYCLTLRYQWTHDADPGWSLSGYVDDPEEKDFDTVDDADYAAEHWALAIRDHSSLWQPLLPDVFGWDGDPWLLGAG